MEIWDFRSAGSVSLSARLPRTRRKIKIAIPRYFLQAENRLDVAVVLSFAVLVCAQLIEIAELVLSDRVYDGSDMWSSECLVRKMSHSSAEVYLSKIFPVLLTHRVLQFTQMNQQLGIMMKIFTRMMSDVAIFGFLALVIMNGFALGFLNGEDAGDGEVSFCTSLLHCDYMLARALLGDFQFDGMRQADAMLLIVYMVMTFIVLLNLLLANMAATFTKTFSRSVLEWKYDRAVLCAKLQRIVKAQAKSEAQAKRGAKANPDSESQQSKVDADLDLLNRELKAVQDDIKTNVDAYQRDLRRKKLAVVRQEVKTSSE